MKHTDIVRKQFDRTGHIYAATPQAADTAKHDALVSLCGTNSSHKVLDVACGPGILSAAFAKVAETVVGLDITPRFLEMARQGAAEASIENITFKEGDVCTMPFPDQAFDIVVCRAAFHHFTDVAAVVAEMHRVVALGGKIVVGDMVASPDEAKANYHHKMEVLCDPSHARALTDDAFTGLFSREGLKLLHKIPGVSSQPLDGWIEHGQPDAAATAEIQELMAQALADKALADLDVREENGGIHFTHQTMLYMAERVS
ncbi:MAG: class I SAM-dependent methyltransferase [Kordiimonadaceae bacterium]|nr:class I SAM-dependent methyltransferase [Kordiimonadaceae bacterium]